MFTEETFNAALRALGANHSWELSHDAQMVLCRELGADIYQIQRYESDLWAQHHPRQRTVASSTPPKRTVRFPKGSTVTVRRVARSGYSDGDLPCAHPADDPWVWAEVEAAERTFGFEPKGSRRVRYDTVQTRLRHLWQQHVVYAPWKVTARSKDLIKKHRRQLDLAVKHHRDCNSAAADARIALGTQRKAVEASRRP